MNQVEFIISPTLLVDCPTFSELLEFVGQGHGGADAVAPGTLLGAVWMLYSNANEVIESYLSRPNAESASIAGFNFEHSVWSHLSRTYGVEVARYRIRSFTRRGTSAK